MPAPVAWRSLLISAAVMVVVVDMIEIFYSASLCPEPIGHRCGGRYWARGVSGHLVFWLFFLLFHVLLRLRPLPEYGQPCVHFRRRSLLPHHHLWQPFFLQVLLKWQQRYSLQ